MLIIYIIATLIVGIAIGILITVDLDSPDHEKRERVTPEMQRVFIQAGPQRALEYFNRDVYRALMDSQKP